MNEDQIDEIKVQLTGLAELDVQKIVAEAHPDIDYNEHVFGEFYISEFIALTERVIKQFQAEFDGEYSYLLPDGYFPEVIPFNLNRNQGVNWPSMGVISIRTALAQFFQYINEKNFTAAAERLKQLIAYQRQNCFWDRSERPIHDASSVKVEEIKAEIEIAKKQQDVMLESLRKITNEYGTRHADLERWAGTVKTRLDEATESNNQISTLLNNSTANDAKLDEIVANQDSIHEKAKGVQSSLTKKLNESTTKLEEIDTALEKSEAYREEIEATRKEVEELTGMWAGAGLGGKFEKRGRLLRISSYFWLFIVILSVVGSVWWLAYSAGKFQLDTENAWLAFVWKLGLITPVVFLLGFVGKQYAKERALEEEYAFRSALSMTLNAFAKQLDLAEGNEPRKKLILDTVEKLYKSPKSLLSHENTSLPHVRNKSYREAIETLTATVEKLSKVDMS